MTTLTEVSKQWATRPPDERFETLEELHAAVLSQKSRSRTMKGEIGKIRAELRQGDVVLVAGNTELVPTHWALGQLCQKIKAPAAYLRRLPADLVRECLNHGLLNGGSAAEPFDPTEPVKLLTRMHDTGNPMVDLRAVNGPDYGRIWNADVIARVIALRDRSGHAFDNPRDWSGKKAGLYASDRDCFAFLCDGGSIVEDRSYMQGDRAMFRGFYVKNSETGAGFFELCWFLFRYVCGNLMIWGAEDVKTVKIRHNRLAPEHFDTQAHRDLKAYLEAPAAPVEQAIQRAADFLLPAEEPKLLEWVTGKGFTKAEANGGIGAARQEEGDARTLWQLVNGLTRYANRFEYADTRVDLSKRAGDLMQLVAS